MYRKAVETILDPYRPNFPAAVRTSAQDLYEKIARENSSLQDFFSEQAADDSVSEKVDPWYTGKDPSYPRKHKIPAVKQRVALLHQVLLEDREFSPEDVAYCTLANMQRTYDTVIRSFASMYGTSTLPVFSLFVLLALVVLEKKGLCETGEKDLNSFVYENLISVLHNVEQFGGTSSQADQIVSWSLALAKCWNEVIPCKEAWEADLFDAREGICDREVGDEELNLPQSADEDKILFDEQEKPTWIKLARSLSKERLHYALREAARFEHMAPIVKQTYSESNELSTEQEVLLSYLSCQNTDTGATLRRCPLLQSILQELWSKLREVGNVLLGEASAKASVDNCSIMEALGNVFKEHLGCAMVLSITMNDAKRFRETQWKVWVSRLHASNRTAMENCSCLSCTYFRIQAQE